MSKHDPSPSSPLVTTRRRFFQVAVGTLSLAGGLIMGIPLVSSLVGPALRLTKRHFTKATGVDSLPTGTPTDVTYPDEAEDAFIRETKFRSIWVIKHSDTNVTAFSPICPHLGCRVNWHEQAKTFICPCHGSVFSITGKVLGGPSPRPLDTLPVKIENGQLQVEWERFKVGIPQKIRA